MLSSLHNAVWYHLGSVAFGSFIIAVFEFVRAIMKYVEAKCKEATQVRRLLHSMPCVAILSHSRAADGERWGLDFVLGGCLCCPSSAVTALMELVAGGCRATRQRHK